VSVRRQIQPCHVDCGSCQGQGSPPRRLVEVPDEVRRTEQHPRSDTTRTRGSSNEHDQTREVSWRGDGHTSQDHHPGVVIMTTTTHPPLIHHDDRTVCWRTSATGESTRIEQLEGWESRRTDGEGKEGNGCDTAPLMLVILTTNVVFTLSPSSTRLSTATLDTECLTWVTFIPL
jgi:hypothetical protein